MGAKVFFGLLLVGFQGIIENGLEAFGGCRGGRCLGHGVAVMEGSVMICLWVTVEAKGRRCAPPHEQSRSRP